MVELRWGLRILCPVSHQSVSFGLISSEHILDILRFNESQASISTAHKFASHKYTSDINFQPEMV